MKNTKEKSDTSKKTKVKISKIKNEKNMKNENKKNTNTNTNKKNEKNENTNKKNEKKIKEPKVTKKAMKVKEEIMEDAEEDMQFNKMMMAMDEIFVKKSGKVDFDRVLDECLKDRDIFTTMNKNEKKRMNQEYQDSFGEIEAFRKSLTKADIDNVDTIVYHDENNDGVFAAVSAYHYYSTTFPNRVEQISLVPMKPGVSFIQPRDEEKIKDKNILILDLDLSPQFMEKLRNITKSIMVIDDHNLKNTMRGEKIFVGTNHAACANTFKFYYPKEEVPNVIKMVDISDSKIGLGEYSNYMNHFTRFIGHRFTHNKTMKKDPKIMMNELWNLIYSLNMNTALFIGHYMDEVENSLKDQIAANARIMNFQGFKVGVLNFNAPSLLKPVLRQINTNFERMGQKIDFALAFGYEFTSDAYSVTMMSNHRPENVIQLGNIAKYLGKIGGTTKGGGGHGTNVGHYYWKRIPGKQDIWDLFTKQYIKKEDYM